MAMDPQQLAGMRSGLTELRQRLFFVLFALLVYRVGTHIPVPGINPEQLALLFDRNQGGIMDLVNMFSGGALERMSILALGVMPYITASIIMNLMQYMDPRLQELRKEGEAGRRTITRYTRYLTVVIALIQASAMSSSLTSLAFTPGWSFWFVAAVSLVTGALFMMWLGEQITERGVGNGISLLIFAGIVSGFPSAIGQSFESARQGDVNVLVLLLVAAVAIGIIGVVVFIERGQRRITINYAKRQQGRQQYQAQTSHLPLKINMAGVIPAIFASSLLLAPASLASWFGQSEGATAGVMQEVARVLSPGQPLYLLLFGGGIIFFAFFYTAIVFNPHEIADNLKKQGAYVPGIRPGTQTAKYIDDVMTRLTMFGGLYIASVCLLPEMMVVFTGITFQLGGTALLIVVVVSMDFMSQVQAHLMSSQYAKLMDKANLKNYGSGRSSTPRR